MSFQYFALDIVKGCLGIIDFFLFSIYIYIYIYSETSVIYFINRKRIVRRVYAQGVSLSPLAGEMQQSSQMLNGGAPSVPLTNITTEQIQKYLDENRQLILTILEYQNQGKFTESASYQARLQQNLTYLAKLADAQQLPTMPPQVHPQSMVVQQHPPQAAVPQQQPVTFATRFPIQLNDDQQQQQLMQAQVGLKPGATSSTHQTMQFGGGNKQDGIGSGGAGDFPGTLASGYSRGDTEPYG